MRISGEQLNELASKIDIVDLIGQTEELHRRGRNYFCCCPFHKNDDTPSLCIYPNSNKWYCFGCDSGSSVFDWIMKKQNVQFPEALRIVCDMVGEDVEEYVESESIAFLKQLSKQKKSKDILVNVRKTLDFADDYLNKYPDELPQEWLNEDMTADALKTYNIRIDPSANRIVYPVFDADGNFIGVKGRTRIESYKELGLAKYMNYNKIGTIDYFQGWQQALPEIINRKSVIIFEGIKSCIKAYGWGIPNTVAAETSKLSDGQIQLLLKTKIPEIIIGFDSDQKITDIIKDSKIQLLKRFTNLYILDLTKKFGDKEAPVDRGEELFREVLERKVKI